LRSQSWLFTLEVNQINPSIKPIKSRCRPLLKGQRKDHPMIDFENSSVFKLKPIDITKARDEFSQFLIDNESIISVFKTVRDQVVFTNKRVIAANVQGLTGSKVDFTSIPFNKIQTFSIETSGTLDLDCEIQIYISSVGKVSFEIKGSFDIVSFNKILSQYVLN
jgi:hypothetical protein